MDRGLLAITTQTLHRIFEWFNLKATAAVGAIIYAYLFGALPYTVGFAVVMLVLMDMVTGVVASKKDGVIISSRRMFATAGKLGIYGLLISAGHLTNTIIGFDLKIDQGVMVVLAATELISILENCAIMGYAIPKRLLNQLYKYRDGE